MTGMSDFGFLGYRAAIVRRDPDGLVPPASEIELQRVVFIRKRGKGTSYGTRTSYGPALSSGTRPVFSRSADAGSL